MSFKKIMSKIASGLLTAAVVLGSAPAINAMAAEESDIYVLMNVPFAEFYAADINNEVPVDGMTSATKAKTKTSKMTNGTYHKDDSGESIDGVIFYVKTTEVDLQTLVSKGAKEITDASTLSITVTNRGKETTTDYVGAKCLYEAPDYSFYKVSEVPAYYKELTINDGEITFSELKGEYPVVATLKGGEDISFKYLTESKYGDYEIDFDVAEGGAVLSSLFSFENDGIYGTVFETTDGTQYVMRQLENVWLGTKIAWSVGKTTMVHNCPVSYAQYESMVGKTISKVTYLTGKGQIVITDLNILVEEKQDIEPMTEEQKTQLEALVAEAEELLKDVDMEKASDAVKNLNAHVKEINSLLKESNPSKVGAAELLEEVPPMIATVKAELKAASNDNDGGNVAPPTGDTTPVAMMVLALVVAGAIGSVAVVAEKKRKKC